MSPETSSSDLHRKSIQRLENICGQIDKARSPSEVGSLVRAAIGEYLENFAHLHSRLSTHPIPTLTNTTPGIIVEIISDTCERNTAYVITNSLVVYLRKRNTEMTGLRAIQMEMFTPVTAPKGSSQESGEQGKSWPIVEWTESDDTRNIAIFHFDEEQCSWIMHSGLPTDAENGEWKTSRVDWNVSDVDHLKILFGVAQHTHGLTQWDPQDILKIYCDREFGNCSIEETKRRAKLLLDHLLKGKQLEHAFDQSKPLLEKIGRKNVSCDDCGDPVVRMGASVYLR